MWSLDLVCLALLLAAVSGVPGLGLRRHLAGGERIAAVLMGCAALCGLAGAIGGLCGAADGMGIFPWPVAEHGLLGLDRLSAFFLVPVFLIGGLGSLYGLGYWPHQQQPVTGVRLRICWGALVAGMGLLVISRNALVFLLGWEIMALAAFFLIVAEEHQAESRQAGWVYLIATHVSTLTLLALCVVWRRATGSYLMEPGALGLLTARQLNYLFVMILIGFGIKAGLMPLHFWLPGAHANAPSHVSAIEGMGSAREVTFACLAEPALFLALMVLARLSGSLSLGTMLHATTGGVPAEIAAPLVLVAIGLFIVLLAEACRIPVDDPATHLELTMIHEAMVLDHSGPLFGAILYGSAVKLLVLGALLYHVVVPAYFGNALDWVVFLAGMLGLAVVIGIVESIMARRRSAPSSASSAYSMARSRPGAWRWSGASWRC